MAEPKDTVYIRFEAISRAFAQGEYIHANTLCTQAIETFPTDPLLQQVALFIQRGAEKVTTSTSAGSQKNSAWSSAVYVQPDAFTEFITTGDNVPLYQAVSNELHKQYRSYIDNCQKTDGPVRITDIGCGDGRALVPAVLEFSKTLKASNRDMPLDVTLVEPSTMITVAQSDLAGEMAISTSSNQITVQEWLLTRPSPCDIMQSSFALQNLTEQGKAQVLRQLVPLTRKFCLIEFDVPELVASSNPASRFDAQRIELIYDAFTRVLQGHLRDPKCADNAVKRGVEKRYLSKGENDFVIDPCLPFPIAQGFLCPILLAMFTDEERSQFELPIAQWTELLTAAGFTDVSVQELYPYDFNRACIITAKGTAE